MKFGKKFLTIAFAMFMLAAGFAYQAEAQTVRVIRRPVIVRNYVYRDPFWRTRYRSYSPLYDSYYSSPYLRFQEQRFALQSELAGNQRELEKHLRKYRADGVITAKERNELDDDYRDVQRARENLRRFTRYYGSNL